MNPVVAVTGVKETINVLKRWRDVKGQDIEKAVDHMADEVKKLALYYCPYDYGPLRGSVKIETRGRWFSRDVTLSFGGPDAPYALYVHEDMTKYHHPPTSAKFLTRAVEESRGLMSQILQRRFSNTFGKTINGAPA